MTLPCLPAPHLGARFEWLAHLGSGGYGRVDLVLDRERGQRVALKQLSAEHRDPGQLKREFRILRDVAHRNLVSMIELVLEPELSCILLEYVDGADLLTHLGTGEDPTVTRTRTALATSSADVAAATAGALRDRGALVTCLAQLCDALEALAARGLVHGDLKPENVLVDRSGRVVVLDFGIARLAGSSPTRAVGTLAYMAPEQLDAQVALDPAADRWALGVLLYRALSGEFPFVGSAREVRAKQRVGPSPLRDGALERLALALLAEDPRRRPSLAAVREALARDRGAPAASSAPPPPVAPQAPAPFVGRDQELDRLLAATRRGAVALLLAGPGLGKTSLLDQFERTSGRRAVRSRCYANESIRWNAVDGLLDDLLTRVTPPSEWSADLAALGRMFPALVGQGPSPGRAPLAERLRAAARGLLYLLARDGAELVILDDVHWADADSMAFLQELLVLAPELPVALAMRGPDARSEGILEALKQSGRDVEPIVLTPLPPTAIRALWAALRHTSELDLARVQSATGGVPFLIEELARSERVEPEEGSGGAAPGPRPRNIRAEDDALMNLLSVHDAPVDGALLRRISRVEAHALGRLVNDRVLRVERPSAGRERYDVYHDVIRQRWLATLDADTRRAAHRTLADAMIAESGAADDVARHLLGAGDARALQWVEAAAEEAERVLAFDRAATWLLRALELGLSAEREAAVRQRLADCYRLNEHHVEAARALEDLAARLPASRARTELRRKAAEQWLTAGELVRGAQVVRELESETGFGLSSRSRAVSLVAERAKVWLALNAPRTRLGGRRREVDTTRIDLAWTVAGCLALVDPVRAGVVHAAGLSEALESGDPLRQARALMGEAAFQGMFGVSARPATEPLLARIDGLAAQLDDHAVGMSRAMRGVVAVERGDFDEGMEHLPLALKALTKHPQTLGWELMPPRHFYMHALFYSGRFDALTEHVQAEYKEAALRQNRHRMSDASLNHATVAWLLSHGADVAAARVREADAFWRGVGPNIQGYYSLVSMLAVALFEGDLDAAWELVRTRGRAAFNSAILVAEGLRIDFLHMLARGAIAGAQGRAGRRALPAAFALTAALARERAPYARALARLQLAQLAGCLGAARSERRLLAQAASALEGAGLHGYARAARAVLETGEVSVKDRALFRVLVPRPASG